MRKERPVTLPKNRLLPLMAIGLISALYGVPHPTLMKCLYIIGITMFLVQIYMSYMKRKIQIQASKLPQSILKNQTVQLAITVSNHSFLPLPYVYIFLKKSYYLVAKETRCLCLTLAPRSEKTYMIAYEAANSGAETIGIERVMLLDYFEWIKRKVKFTHMQEIVVLPQAVSLKKAEEVWQRALQEGQEERVASQPVEQDEGEVSYELSPYEEGTPQRLIHWKLVAQRDIYMVREREKPTGLKKEQVVIIDSLMPEIKEKYFSLKKLFPTLRARQRWEIERRRAAQKDQIITSCISYLYGALNESQCMQLVYCEEGAWQTCTVKKVQDLEHIEEVLCKQCFATKVAGEIRWPLLERNDRVQKIVLTAFLNPELKRKVEQVSGVQVIVMQGGKTTLEKSVQKKGFPYWLGKKKAYKEESAGGHKVRYYQMNKDFEMVSESGG